MPRSTIIESSGKPIIRPTIKETEIKPQVDIQPKLSPSKLENLTRGRNTEAEQLSKLGLEKNTKPFEAIDPKTGNKGTTIPDGMTKKGGTIEIKDTKYQGFTRQLRLQKEVSKSVGETPILRINQGAELNKPMDQAGFEIQRYSFPVIKADNTKVIN